MKKHIILLAVTLLWGVAAMAQQADLHFAMAHSMDNVTFVYTDDGRSFEVKGDVLDLGLDGNTVWTLTKSESSHILNNLIVPDFRVYKNDQRRKSYRGNENERYFSMAMRVKDGHVIIAGSKVWPFNNRGFESCLFGEVDFERVFETDYVRKSLKRENFRGFCEYKNNKMETPSFDEDGTSVFSVYYGVKDVDYYKGNIYATGWGEREYTKTYYGSKYYFVRRCPRVWKNGKEVIQQVENQTGAAYNINVINADGKKHVLTSGHNRGYGAGWDGNNTVYSIDFSVEKEAVIAKGSKIYHCCLPSKFHLTFIVQEGNSGSVEKTIDGADYKAVFFDVVADPDNMDFYLLTRGISNNDYEVWRLHCSGSTLKAPQKVYTFHADEAGINPTLAISR
ncbi:MAG: hypothetical protein K6A64_11135 [Bacteroidales bacterium]|nr:hypothetical protein [Bacteroidales bacterium]